MKTLIYIITLCFAPVIWGQSTNTEVVAKIKTKKVDNTITIIGTATNTTEVYKTLKYSLLVTKTGVVSDNTSKNTQGGRFTLSENETKKLSTIGINMAEKDKVVVLLLIYEEDQIIGKDRIAFNEKKKTKKKVEKNNDGIELKGIVIEETKTKPGRDFYETFYNKYTFSNINGNRIVGIYEKLSLGRSTIIQVKIDDNIIHEFLGKPDLEYLTEMATLSLRRVYKHFKDLEKQEQHIKQY